MFRVNNTSSMFTRVEDSSIGNDELNKHAAKDQWYSTKNIHNYLHQAHFPSQVSSGFEPTSLCENHWGKMQWYTEPGIPTW